MSNKMINRRSIYLTDNIIIHLDKIINREPSPSYMGTLIKDTIEIPVIIKILSTVDLMGNNINYTREINIAEGIINNPHKNIIKVYDVIKQTNKIYIVTEYCHDGDMSTILFNPLKEDIAKYYFYQIASGIRYMKDNNIIHRDIKPKNIMLSDNRLTLKLADFGFAKIQESKMVKSTSICGSPLYMAPEILNINVYSDSVDIWALGIIMYEMLFGSHPFESCKDYEELRRMAKTTINIPNSVNISHEALELLKKLLSVNSSRIDIDDVLLDEWLSDIKTPEYISLKNMYYKNSSLNTYRKNEHTNIDSDDNIFIFTME